MSIKFVGESSINLANETRKASDLLVAFHSRLAKQGVSRPWERLLPQKFFCIGTVNRTDYNSDKDDPETREPSKRAKDPDGVQGVWKHFTHKHSPGVSIYTTAKNYQHLQSKRDFGGTLNPPDECIEVSWPQIMTYLSEIREFDVTLPDGRTKIIEPRGLQLWSFPDSKTLVAMRSPNKYNAPNEEIYVLNGGGLCVTWRGIQF